MIHDPGVLTGDSPRSPVSGDVDWERFLPRSDASLLQRNPLRRRARVEQDETFVAFENQIPVTERSHETKSCPPGHRCVQLVIGSQGLFRGNDRLRRLGNEAAAARDAGGVAMTWRGCTSALRAASKMARCNTSGRRRTPPSWQDGHCNRQGRDPSRCGHTGRMLTALDNAQVGFAKRLLDRQAMNRTPVEITNWKRRSRRPWPGRARNPPSRTPSPAKSLISRSLARYPPPNRSLMRTARLSARGSAAMAEPSRLHSKAMEDSPARFPGAHG